MLVKLYKTVSAAGAVWRRFKCQISCNYLLTTFDKTVAVLAVKFHKDKTEIVDRENLLDINNFGNKMRLEINNNMNITAVLNYHGK